jgi:hypothetical protein
LYALYTNLFDNVCLQDNPFDYHAVVPVCPFFENKTPSDEGEQEYFQILIDQRYIDGNNSSGVHDFQNSLQSKFLEVNETNVDNETPIFDDYAYFLEMSLSIDISFTDHVQLGNTNLLEQRPLTEGIEHEVHKDFFRS